MSEPFKDCNTRMDLVSMQECPVCRSILQHSYFMQDSVTKKKSKWFACSCGIVFNAQKPTKVYDLKYWLEHSKYSKKDEESYQYPVKIYAPLIEELIYNRRVLIVGRPNTYQETAFEERGWVPTIIDKNTSFKTAGNIIAADFEDYQFPVYKHIDLKGEEHLERVKYGLVWIDDTLQCFSDPMNALSKAADLLAEDGILYLGSPDSDFINTRSSSCFIHWRHDENYILWNRRSITKHLEQLGFNVIMIRQNYEHRFNVWDNFHLIAQKRFF